jgi:hypothetical protein
MPGTIVCLEGTSSPEMLGHACTLARYSISPVAHGPRVVIFLVLRSKLRGPHACVGRPTAPLFRAFYANAAGTCDPTNDLQVLPMWMESLCRVYYILIRVMRSIAQHMGTMTSKSYSYVAHNHSHA